MKHSTFPELEDVAVVYFDETVIGPAQDASRPFSAFLVIVRFARPRQALAGVAAATLFGPVFATQIKNDQKFSKWSYICNVIYINCMIPGTPPYA